MDYLIGILSLPWLPGSSVPNLMPNLSNSITFLSQSLLLPPFHGFAFPVLVEWPYCVCLYCKLLQMLFRKRCVLKKINSSILKSHAEPELAPLAPCNSLGGPPKWPGALSLQTHVSQSSSAHQRSRETRAKITRHFLLNGCLEDHSGSRWLDLVGRINVEGPWKVSIAPACTSYCSGGEYSV